MCSSTKLKFFVNNSRGHCRPTFFSGNIFFLFFLFFKYINYFTLTGFWNSSSSHLRVSSVLLSLGFCDFSSSLSSVRQNLPLWRHHLTRLHFKFRAPTTAVTLETLRFFFFFYVIGSVGQAGNVIENIVIFRASKWEMFRLHGCLTARSGRLKHLGGLKGFAEYFIKNNIREANTL